jgi:RNA polymerase sigma-70 factor (ECF subfamily)
MKSFKNTIIVLLLTIVLPLSVTQAKSPRIMLQEGLYAEQTEGDLEKAIDLYQQVLEQYQKVEHIAAKATYQLGMCHLKNGDQDKAVEYFQTIVDDFSDQVSLAQTAQEQLDKIIPPDEFDTSSMMLSPDAYGFIVEKHFEAGKKANELGIPSNTHVYGIDDAYTKYSGGLIDVFNMSDQAWTEPTKIAQFTCNNTNLDLYNDMGEKQQFEWKEVDLLDSKRCQLIWTPDRPVAPDEFRVFGYIYKKMETLPKTKDGRKLVMKNNFGSEVIESFFLILPDFLKIVDKSSEITAYKRFGDMVIYEFQRHIKGESNKITVVLDRIGEYAESAKPIVIESFPKTYSNDVDPETDQMSVTFDQDMFQHGWSWCSTGAFPESGEGETRYIDPRTCVLPVKLEPGRAYSVFINLKQYQSFRNVDEIPAREFVLVFATKDADGNPTEIPEEMLARAKETNDKIAIPEPVLDIVPAGVRAYIASHFRQTHEDAEQKGLRTNSHVHIIDEDFNRDFGMVHIYKNKTDKVIDYEVSLGSNDSPENYVYDEEGVRQKIRTKKIPGSNYRYFWTPSKPIAAGESRMLLYSWGKKELKGLDVNDKNRVNLRLQNYYGSPVIENFYVVLPAGIEINSQTEEFTSHERIEDFNVYCWSSEQGRNVNHRVDLKLAKAQ